METSKNNTKKIIIAVVALIAVIGVLLGVYMATKGSVTEGQKNITIDIVHKNQEINTFKVTTDQEMLGDVLKDEALVEGEDGAYGMYITAADGETADEGKQEWWCLTKGGEQLNTSADQTPIADGDKYELTFTVGF